MQYDFLSAKGNSKKESDISTIQSGAKHLFIALSIFIIYCILIHFLFSNNLVYLFKNWRYDRLFYPEIDFRMAFENSWSGKKMAILLLGQFIDNTLKYIIGTMLIVGAIRLCGVPIFRGIYRPFLAKNLTDFYYRFYFFYSRLFFDLVYFPIFYRLRWIKNATFRPLLALFTAIFVGGLLFHFVKNYGLVFKTNYLEALNWQWQFYPYFLLVASSCCLSSYLQLKSIALPIPQPLRIFFYFFLIFIGQLINAVRVMDLPPGTEWLFLSRLLH